MIRFAIAALLTAFLAAPAAAQAQPADLNVICAVALERVVRPVAAEFEQSTGTPVHVVTGEAAALASLVQQGHAADVILLPPALLAALEAKGLARKGTRMPLVSTSLGFATRAQDPAADVSTRDTLRAALLGARKVYHLDPKQAPSGIYYAKLVQTLGIAEQMSAKSVVKPPETIDHDLAADKGAGPVLGFLIKSGVTHTAGATFLGPLPGSLASSPSWAAELGSQAENAKIARAFLFALTSTDTQRRFAADGLDPAP